MRASGEHNIILFIELKKLSIEFTQILFLIYYISKLRTVYS
jgi:hypothetical protein